MKKIVLMALSAMLMLTGCSTGSLLTSSEPQQTIYTLRALRPVDAPSTVSAKVVEISTPSLAPGLDTDRIALMLVNGQKLDYYASARWADSFGNLIQSFTRRTASAVLPYVVAVAPEQGLNPDYKLQVKINELQPIYAADAQGIPVVTANVEFTLIRMPSERIVTSFALSMQQTPAENRLDLIVLSLETLLQNIQQEAFAKMDTHLRRAKEY